MRCTVRRRSHSISVVFRRHVEIRFRKLSNVPPASHFLACQSVPDLPQFHMLLAKQRCIP